MGLSLTRRTDEVVVMLVADIEIQVRVDVVRDERGNALGRSARAQLTIDAPPEVTIYRKEVFDRIPKP